MTRAFKPGPLSFIKKSDIVRAAQGARGRGPPSASEPRARRLPGTARPQPPRAHLPGRPRYKGAAVGASAGERGAGSRGTTASSTPLRRGCSAGAGVRAGGPRPAPGAQDLDAPPHLDRDRVRSSTTLGTRLLRASLSPAGTEGSGGGGRCHLATRWLGPRGCASTHSQTRPPRLGLSLWPQLAGNRGRGGGGGGGPRTQELSVRAKPEKTMGKAQKSPLPVPAQGSRGPSTTSEPAAASRCLCQPGPPAPSPGSAVRRGPPLPAALRTTRGSEPGRSEAAPPTTAKATATQSASARAGAPMAGTGPTSSGGARGHGAPHGPARSPAQAGGRAPESAGGGRGGELVTGRGGARQRPGPRAPSPSPRPPRPPPPPRAPGPPGAGRLLPAAVPPSLPLPSPAAAEPSQGGGGKLSRAGSARPAGPCHGGRSGPQPAARPGPRGRPGDPSRRLARPRAPTWRLGDPGRHARLPPAPAASRARAARACPRRCSPFAREGPHGASCPLRRRRRPLSGAARRARSPGGTARAPRPRPAHTTPAPRCSSRRAGTRAGGVAGGGGPQCPPRPRAAGSSGPGTPGRLGLARGSRRLRGRVSQQGPRGDFCSHRRPKACQPGGLWGRASAPGAECGAAAGLTPLALSGAVRSGHVPADPQATATPESSRDVGPHPVLCPSPVAHNRWVGWSPVHPWRATQLVSPFPMRTTVPSNPCPWAGFL